MKKVIFILPVVAVMLITSCTQVRKWGETEREALRKEVRTLRDRSAIRHMEDANYQNLEDCVATTIEGTYPDYNKFDKLTGKKDTLDAVSVSCLGFALGPNFENLPLLFPPTQLQQSGILAADLTNDQIQSFYMCLAAKMQQLYNTPQQFVSAMFNEPGVPTGLTEAMQQCASEVVPAPAVAAPKKK